jgi:hypothetical protein
MGRIAAYELGNIVEGQSLILKARLVTDIGTRISSDGASSTIAATGIDVRVYDAADTPPVLKNTTTALAVATGFTAGATGFLTTGWETDSTGYNFLVVMPTGSGAAFNVDFLGGHTYLVEVVVTTAATINPGAQAEGPITFTGRLYVEPALGQT